MNVIRQINQNCYQLENDGTMYILYPQTADGPYLQVVRSVISKWGNASDRKYRVKNRTLVDMALASIQ